MDNIVRWLLVALLVLHALIHFLGAAKGFGWAPVPELKNPISTGLGAVWLVGGVLILACAAMIGAGAPSWWWAIAVLAALVSQVAIVGSWSDARFGTIINVLLLVVPAYGFLSVGPFSFSAILTTHADTALEQVDMTPPVVDALSFNVDGGITEPRSP